MMKPLPQTDLHEIAARCAPIFRDLDGAHVLITGASGFVGAWLDDAGSHAGVRVYAHKGRASRDIRALTVPGHITHVIHCASAASGADNARDPRGVADMIAGGTLRVMQECRRVGVSRLLVLSSGSVYVPKSNGSAYREDDETKFGGQSGDAISVAKAMSEAFALADHGTPTVSARGFGMLGPRLPAHLAPAQFMADAVANRPIRVTNPGTLRSYLYATDVAAWLWTLLVKGEAGTAYNVGGNNRMPVETIARLIAYYAEGRVEMGDGATVPSLLGDTIRARALGLRETLGIDVAVQRWLAWERGA